MRVWFLLILVSLTGLFINSVALAQNDSLPGKLTFSGYLEAYWGEDITDWDKGERIRPPFFVSYHRNKEVALNMALLQTNYTRQGIKVNFGVMAGTYAEMNLSNEAPLFQHLYEANVSLRLSRKKDWWVEAGLFPSHIGFESAIGYDCWNLTRSILAENSPYYEQGLRFNYTSPNKKWFVSFLGLNGWQTIQNRTTGQFYNSFIFSGAGHQLTWRPSEKITLNSSSYLGYAPRPVAYRYSSLSVYEGRVFHNLYGIFQVARKWGLIAGFDYGVHYAFSNNHIFYSPVLIGRYEILPKFRVSVRTEYYQDDQQSVIDNYYDRGDGLQCFGYSGNLDYEPFPGALFRLEFRSLLYVKPWYTSYMGSQYRQHLITTSMGFRF
jgi:hypothetical protein